MTDPIGARSQRYAESLQVQQAFAEFTLRRVLAVTFPIGRPEYRSAFYATLEGAHFVITASHFLEESHIHDVKAVARVRQGLIPVKDPKERPWWEDRYPGRSFAVPLKAFRWTEADPLDLLVMRVDPLPSFEGWLEAYDLSKPSVKLPADGPMMVGGYPIDHAKMRPLPDPKGVQARLSYYTYATGFGDSDGIHPYDPKYHFLLKYEKADIRAQGLSGAPVWRLNLEYMDFWRPNPELIGVQSSVYKQNKVLKAVRIEHAVKLAKEML